MSKNVSSKASTDKNKLAADKVISSITQGLGLFADSNSKNKNGDDEGEL